MPDNLEDALGERLRNGKAASHATRLSSGLGNTNPVATVGSTWGVSGSAGARAHESEHSHPSSYLERVREGFEERQGLLEPIADVLARSSTGMITLQVKAFDKQRGKVAGQVVLFRKVMEDWDFQLHEAATLLGFEVALDIQGIYEGRKPVGHRDANDRLRAVLRIAADLDALYRDETTIREWLSEEQKDLGGATPRAMMLEGSMENLLRVRYYIAYLSGR